MNRDRILRVDRPREKLHYFYRDGRHKFEICLDPVRSLFLARPLAVQRPEIECSAYDHAYDRVPCVSDVRKRRTESGTEVCLVLFY